jgi:ubiquinone/menaquinone biosynthesis C-methylase UbiE
MDHAAEATVGEHLMHVGPREGYRRWSTTYDETPNPVLALESRLLPEFLPGPAGLRVLDAGCGTGRWMRWFVTRGAHVCGIDACPEMIAVARVKSMLRDRCVVGDISALPWRENTFDLALCSFSLSYTPDLRLSLLELARVARIVVVSDLHPEAMRRGWKRSFRENGESCQIDYQPYSSAELDRAAADVGLKLYCRVEPHFGEPEQGIFKTAGSASAFDSVREVPAVLISKWTR